MSDVNQKEKTLTTTYIIYPHWGALFFAIGGAILIVIGVLIRFLLALSAASDMVFAVEALISGLCAEIVFHKILHRKLIVAPKVKIPFICLWPLLCLYVFIARPFE